MTSTPYRAVIRLRMVIVVALAVTASSVAPAANIAFAQSTLYPGAVGLVANTGGEPVLLRETPSFDAAVLTPLSEGTPADILAGPVYSPEGTAWHMVSVGGMTGYVVAGYLVSHHRARSAADLAALSGAAVHARGEDACDQARRIARRNGARVTRCDQVGDSVDFVVTVRVVVEVGVRSPGLPRRVQAEAHAGRVN